MLLRLVVESRDGHVLIRAAGELDMSSAASLISAVEDALGDGHEVVLIELSGVTFLDSTGLSALMVVHRAAEAHHAYVALVAPNDSAVRVMHLLGVDDLLHVHDTVEDALRHD